MICNFSIYMYILFKFEKKYITATFWITPICWGPSVKKKNKNIANNKENESHSHIIDQASHTVYKTHESECEILTKTVYSELYNRRICQIICRVKQTKWWIGTNPYSISENDFFFLCCRISKCLTSFNGLTNIGR